jgi:hypothetical protein
MTASSPSPLLLTSLNHPQITKYAHTKQRLNGGQCLSYLPQAANENKYININMNAQNQNDDYWLRLAFHRMIAYYLVVPAIADQIIDEYRNQLNVHAPNREVPLLHELLSQISSKHRMCHPTQIPTPTKNEWHAHKATVKSFSGEATRVHYILWSKWRMVMNTISMSQDSIESIVTTIKFFRL